ncbi:MAG: PorT family protein [Tannerella sp.]|jgi:hypothetical protein|nr:PorT family protein [Tannerella sp.]
MNKKGFILLMFLFSTFYGHSQLTWNVKAGMNLSRVTNDQMDIDLKPGYQVGAGMDYFFNDHWGIQSSLMLISKGYKSKGDYNYPPAWEAPAKTYDRTENRVYIELPVTLAYKFKIAAHINLILSSGGYISYGIAGKHKNNITLKDGHTATDKYNTFAKNTTDKFDTGIVGGATLEFRNKYTIGLVGEWGLKSAIGDFSKNQTYGLNIGYKF